MKKVYNGIIFTMGVIICLVAIISILGLIFWGLGNFIILLFGITKVWTFVQSLRVALIYYIICLFIKLIVDQIEKKVEKGE